VTTQARAVGQLLVGTAAKAIALVHGKPLVPVHHVAGHVAAAFAHGEIRCRR
jgi:N6-L-threonylcarbamoyladenine synthase